jgi:hypothetical protein
MRKQTKKAMSIPSLKRVKHMAFIKRAVFKKKLSLKNKELS